MRAFRLTVFLLAALPLLVAAPTAAVECTPVTVPGLPDVCRTSDGLLRLPGGTYTHGPDGDPSTGWAISWAPGQRPPVCVADTTKHVQLIYARAYDDVDDYARMAPWLRYEFESANWVLNEAAVATGSTSADYRVACNAGVPSVPHVVLPTPMAEDSFTSVINDIRAAGYTSSLAKYVVFYDQVIITGYAGVGEFHNDDRLSSSNLNLTGGMVAVATSMSYNVLMHELSHTMGAVQNSAPNSTGAAHCVDGTDVMCYADGGPRGGEYSSGVCTGARYFDCNHNDYFNTHPAPGSYLAAKWNVASTLNPWLNINYAAPPPPPPPPPPPGDTTPPTFTVTHPAAGVHYDLLVVDAYWCDRTNHLGPRAVFQSWWLCASWTASDPSGLNRLEVWLRGTLIETHTWNLAGGDPCCRTFEYPPPRQNNVPLELRMYDNAGNVAVWSANVDLAYPLY